MNLNITKKNKKNYLFIALTALCVFVLFLYSAGASSNNSTIQNKVSDSNQAPIYEPNKNIFSDDFNFTGNSSINGTEIFYRIMLSIVFVLILGAAAIFITKKYLPKIAKLQGKEIQVIETVHLGPRKSVHLIEIGKRRFLIGSTNENIRKLADLTDFSSSMPIQEDELD